MSIADKIKTRVFKQNEIIMRKGEIGNEMYVSIKGKLGVYLENFDIKKRPAHIVEEFNVVGEKSLEYSNVPRNATIICLDPEDTICLEITRQDYKRIINVSYMIKNVCILQR